MTPEQAAGNETVTGGFFLPLPYGLTEIVCAYGIKLLPDAITAAADYRIREAVPYAAFYFPLILYNKNRYPCLALPEVKK
ncbi:MAG: hypothetical protein K0R57_792 [Paenibacillaceae bacterium]|nr:hypothetical protein [Paenibacillaceae bacterium]